MIARNLFGGPMAQRVAHGEMRVAMAGNSPGAKSRAAAKAKGKPIPGEPGTEGMYSDGGVRAPIGREAALRASMPRRFTRNGLFPFGQKVGQALDTRKLSEVVQQMMMKGGR